LKVASWPGLAISRPRVSTPDDGKAIHFLAASWLKMLNKEVGMRILKSFVLAGAVVAMSSPVFAAAMVDTPMGSMDIDPLNIMGPEAPAGSPAMAKHHHMMKHHMMKHHMSKKKM
jgi:hypothetical protein